MIAARAPLRVGTAAAITAGLAASLVAEERLLDVSPERREAYVRMWARGMLHSLRVDLDVRGEVPSQRASRLVVANHRSTLDIFIMLALFGGHLLARGDMEHWPAVGWMAKKAGTIFVDRADAGSGAAAVRKLTDCLRRGRGIGVFAEGTTFDDDEVRPFHAGAFMAIARVRGEVIPVGVAYEDRAAHYRDEPIASHFRRLLDAPRTRVAVTIGSRVESAGASIRQMAAHSHEAVQQLVHESRRRLAPSLSGA